MAVEAITLRRLDPDRVKSLAGRLAGAVVLPDDAAYDQARMAWNLSYQHRPALVVMARNAPDIAAAVVFAREADLDIAAQATGHGVRRPADDCLLINTSQMNQVRLNAEARTAWVEAGAKWGIILEKAQAMGLAPLLGSSPDVGAVGYTLGGGMGWLGRKYGLSSDNVRRFEVVTADGRLLSASETENADLFWGLRGGGGSLAIVTGMEIRLHPVDKVYGGNLIYPVDLAGEVFRRYRSWIEAVPTELTSSVILMNYPPLPEIPEPLRGRLFVQVRGCFIGPVEKGEALLRFWRDWRTPFIDDFKIMPFSQVATISAEPVDPIPALSSGAFLKVLDDRTIESLIRHAVPGGQPAPLLFAEIRHMGGLIAAVDPASSAYGNRQAQLSLHMVGLTPTPEAYSALSEYVKRVKGDLQPGLTGGVYLNFLEGQESLDRTRDGYSPDSYRRLMALKAAYDPENRLRYSLAIPPASVPQAVTTSTAGGVRVDRLSPDVS